MKMQLKEKNTFANAGCIRKLSVSMKWTTAADFDLAAVYEDKNGKTGIVYFGDQGSASTYPYMCSGGDAGVGDIGGDNEETLLICRLDEMKYVWIMCWDYGKIQQGQPARFQESDILITFTDDRGNIFHVSPDNISNANAALIATIDNSSPVGAGIINSSRAGLLKGLKKMQQLTDIIRQDQEAKPTPTRIILE